MFINRLKLQANIQKKENYMFILVCIYLLENILIQNLLKENRECNKIVAMFVEQNKKHTHPYELQFTKILFFTINFNLIVRCT